MIESTMPLCVDSLSKIYTEKRGLLPTSFTVSPGELIAVVGHNGAGKSTLLKLLGGWLVPDDGAVRIDGIDFGNRRSIVRKVGFVPEIPNLFEFFSFEILQGKPNQILAGKDNMVITQKISERLFGKENPLGKLVEYDNNSYIITGIVADIPLNSHIQFDAVFPIETLLSASDVNIGWDRGMSASTFVKLFSNDLKTDAMQT